MMEKKHSRSKRRRSTHRRRKTQRRTSMIDDLFDTSVSTLSKIQSKREQIKKKATWLISQLVSRRDKEEEQYEFSKDQDELMNQNGCYNLFSWITPKDETFLNREEILEASSPINVTRKITDEIQFKFEKSVNEKVNRRRVLRHDVPFRRVESLKDHVTNAVYASYQTSVTISEHNDFAIFGRGNEGQLGFGPVSFKDKPEIMTLARWNNRTHEPGRGKVLSVSLGLRHTLVLLRDRVYVWGSNKQGQLNHRASLGCYLWRPMVMDSMKNPEVRIIKIACGVSHSILLDDKGTVYTFGDGTFGQLGQRKVTSCSRPEPVQSRRLRQRKVTQIASGAFHVVVVTETKDVWAWGRGHTIHGGDPLGLGLRKNVFSAKRVVALEKEFVGYVTCGERHTILCDRTRRKIYMTGDNEKGQLGLGDTNPRVVPERIMKGLPDNVVIKRASGGGTHTALVTKSGDLYTFGFGRSCRLGYLTTSDYVQTTPRLVNSIRDAIAQETREHPITDIIDLVPDLIQVSLRRDREMLEYTWTFSNPKYQPRSDVAQVRHLFSRLSELLASQETLDRELEYQRLYQRFDTKGKSRMDAIELKDLFAAHGIYLNIIQADKIIDEIDEDENHVIDENEFVNWMIEQRDLNRRPGNFFMNLFYRLFYKQSPICSVGPWAVQNFEKRLTLACQELHISDAFPQTLLDSWFRHNMSPTKGLRFGHLVVSGVSELTPKMTAALVNTIWGLPIVQTIDLTHLKRVGASVAFAFFSLVKRQSKEITRSQRHCEKCNYRMTFVDAYRNGIHSEYLPCVRCAHRTSRPVHVIHEIRFPSNAEATITLDIAKHDLCASHRIACDTNFRELDVASDSCSLENCKGYTFERFCKDWKGLVNEYEMCHRDGEEETKKKVLEEEKEDDDDEMENTTSKVKIVRRQSSLKYKKRGGRSHKDNAMFLTGQNSMSPQEHFLAFCKFRKKVLDPFFSKTAWRFYCVRVNFFCCRFMKSLQRALIDDFFSHFEKGKLVKRSLDMMRRKYRSRLERFFELWTVSRDISESMRTHFLSTSESVRLHFQRLVTSSQIAQVRCGSLHTVALSRAGDVWTCGALDGGQLGQGNHLEAITDMYKISQIEVTSEMREEWILEKRNEKEKAALNREVLSNVHETRKMREKRKRTSLVKKEEEKTYTYTFDGKVIARESVLNDKGDNDEKDELPMIEV